MPSMARARSSLRRSKPRSRAAFSCATFLTVTLAVLTLAFNLGKLPRLIPPLLCQRQPFPFRNLLTTLIKRYRGEFLRRKCIFRSYRGAARTRGVAEWERLTLEKQRRSLVAQV